MSAPRPFGESPVGGVLQTPEDLVGRVVGDRYKIKEILGRGGMGSVYLGEHIALRKLVAIKVLHQDLCRDQTQLDRFLQEARAASTIRHENVVYVADFGSAPGGSLFFAMEYLEGEDLACALRREGRFGWPRTRHVMLQVVRGLRAAHDQGIIHRDLNPANCFLVKRSDGRDLVKVLDFGVAKVTDPSSDAALGRLTRTGVVIGTAKYMAPEQARGEPADRRTDIYAAAICMYRLLTGRVPYDGDNFMQILGRHIYDPLTPPRSAAPDASITPAVESVIIKALSKRREDRYQDMAEFEAALLAIDLDGNLTERFREGLPAAASGLTQPEDQGRPVEGPCSTLRLEPWRENGSLADGNRVPERRGSTLLLDANPGAEAAADGSAAAEDESTEAVHGSGENVLAAEARSVTTRDTMFGDEGRSPAKFAALLICGASAAVLLGGLLAFALLDERASTQQLELPQPANLDKQAPSPDPRPRPSLAGDPMPEIPIEPPQPRLAAEPPADAPAPETTIPSQPAKAGGDGHRRHRSRRTPRRGDIATAAVGAPGGTSPSAADTKGDDEGASPPPDDEPDPAPSSESQQDQIRKPRSHGDLRHPFE